MKINVTIEINVTNDPEAFSDSEYTFGTEWIKMAILKAHPLLRESEIRVELGEK